MSDSSVDFIGDRAMNGQSETWLLGEKLPANVRDFSDQVAWEDHKIRFIVTHCRGKDVLDLGCVQHNPENYKSKYWVHKALTRSAKSVDGIDLYENGVNYLKSIGYNITVGNAERFRLEKRYDVIVAGDLIEHLENLGDFFECCKLHLRPEGKLLISTPNPWHWRFILKAALFKGRVKPNAEHTLWICPTVLSNMASRHDLKVTDWKIGSRYLKDRLIPLPKGIKHGSFHAVICMNIQ